MSIPSSQRSTTQISGRILTGISTQKCLCHLHMPNTAFCCSTCHGWLTAQLWCASLAHAIASQWHQRLDECFVVAAFSAASGTCGRAVSSKSGKYKQRDQLKADGLPSAAVQRCSSSVSLLLFSMTLRLSSSSSSTQSVQPPPLKKTGNGRCSCNILTAKLSKL